MLAVNQIRDGVFRVELTSMHYQCLTDTAATTQVCCEAVLAMWVGSGMVELADFAESRIIDTGKGHKMLDHGGVDYYGEAPENPKKTTELVWVKGERCDVFEYCCGDCKQLRLSYVLTDTCRNCGSTDIVKGKPGTLKRS